MSDCAEAKGKLRPLNEASKCRDRVLKTSLTDMDIKDRSTVSVFKDQSFWLELSLARITLISIPP